MKTDTRKSNEDLWHWAARDRAARHAILVERALLQAESPKRWSLAQVRAFFEKLWKAPRAKVAKGR